MSPDRKLELTDTALGASKFEQPRGQRTTIDLFFRSLCSAHGDIFAVILSGGGADGSLNAKTVKEVGGLVLVQEPHEAVHESMPRAAIATGIADIVLPVQELAHHLADLIGHRSNVVHLATPAEDEAALRSVLDLLRRRTRHDFANYKRNTVLRRMQLNYATSLQDYLEENVEKVQALLITVTTFFRDPEAWATLHQQVIVYGPAQRSLSAAGCPTAPPGRKPTP